MNSLYRSRSICDFTLSIKRGGGHEVLAPHFTRKSDSRTGLPAAEPADTHSILFFHTGLSFAHAYQPPCSLNWALKKKKQAQSLSLRILSELLGNLREEIVGVDGVVDERFSALVMDALSEGGLLPKTLFHGHAEPRLVNLSVDDDAVLPRS